MFRSHTGSMFYWDKRLLHEYGCRYMRPDYVVEDLLDPCPIRNASHGLAPDPSGMRVTRAQTDEMIGFFGWEAAWGNRRVPSGSSTYVGCHRFYRSLALACDALGLVR